MFGLKKRTWIIGGVLVALIGTGAVAARYHNADPQKRAEWATERVADRMDLTDEQKKAFGKVAQKYAEIRGTTPELMVDLQTKLKELAADETLTVEEVNTLKDQIKAEFDRRADILIPEFVGFYNTLNKEQRDMVVSRLDRMGKWMERGGKRGHHRSKRSGEHRGWRGER